ncbi:MAG: hypothetical protein U0Z44_05845 [Kouleothrix sp.]
MIVTIGWAGSTTTADTGGRHLHPHAVAWRQRGCEHDLAIGRRDRVDQRPAKRIDLQPDADAGNWRLSRVEQRDGDAASDWRCTGWAPAAAAQPHASPLPARSGGAGRSAGTGAWRRPARWRYGGWCSRAFPAESIGANIQPGVTEPSG